MPQSSRINILQPTWKQGFARSASESAHPQLWPRLGAWAPGLGPTGIEGDLLRDVSGNNNHFTLDGGISAMTADDWVIGAVPLHGCHRRSLARLSGRHCSIPSDPFA